MWGSNIRWSHIYELENVSRRSYGVSTKSTTSCVGCPRVRTGMHALRLLMARVVDHGFSLRRPTKILRTHRPDRVEAYKDRHRFTSQWVANVQAGRRQTTPRQPDRCKLHTLFPQPGPHHSRTHRDLFRVQSISFDHHVTVYPADDYDRKSPWMYIA